MKVILKEDIESLGKAGDAIKVADGYARNYLIPKGLAVEASGKNVMMIEQEKKLVLQKLEKQKKIAESMAAKAAGVVCTIKRRIGEQDKLFGSVNPKDIEAILKENGVDIDKKWIVLEEPIKALGEYPVKIKFPGGVVAEIKVAVIAES
jgi:large subunit ribosomal protein L9